MLTIFQIVYRVQSEQSPPLLVPLPLVNVKNVHAEHFALKKEWEVHIIAAEAHIHQNLEQPHLRHVRVADPEPIRLFPVLLAQTVVNLALKAVSAALKVPSLSYSAFFAIKVVHLTHFQQPRTALVKFVKPDHMLAEVVPRVNYALITRTTTKPVRAPLMIVYVAQRAL